MTGIVESKTLRTHIRDVRIRTCVRTNFAASANVPSLFACAHFARKCLCVTYTCRHMCVFTCRRAHAGLAAYIIVRLIFVINILQTAITRRPACLRDINYGWLRRRLQRPRGGQIVSTKGQSTRGDAIERKGKSLTPVKFIRSRHDNVSWMIVYSLASE